VTIFSIIYFSHCVCVCCMRVRAYVHTHMHTHAHICRYVHMCVRVRGQVREKKCSLLVPWDTVCVYTFMHFYMYYVYVGYVCVCE